MLHRIIERVGDHSPTAGLASNKNAKSFFSLHGMGIISNKLKKNETEANNNDRPAAGFKKALSFLLKGDENSKGTIVSRQYWWILIGSLVIYVLLHIIIRLNTTVVCNVHEPFSPYTIFVAVAILGCYGLSAIYYLLSAKLTSSWSQEEAHVKSVFYCSATIVVIAGVATALYLTEDGSNVCLDALGIASMNSQWAEWLVEAPLMAYIATAIEDKAQLIRSDYTSIFLTYVPLYRCCSTAVLLLVYTLQFMNIILFNPYTHTLYVVYTVTTATYPLPSSNTHSHTSTTHILTRTPSYTLTPPTPHIRASHTLPPPPTPTPHTLLHPQSHEHRFRLRFELFPQRKLGGGYHPMDPKHPLHVCADCDRVRR